MDGFPWSIPSALSPTSATAYAGMSGRAAEVWTTVPSTCSAWRYPTPAAV